MPSLIPFSYTFFHTIYSGLFYLIELQLIFINSEVIVTEAESIASTYWALIERISPYRKREIKPRKFLDIIPTSWLISLEEQSLR